ncbi:MAG: hypothetical protein OXR62_09140 [Ahrensia sp.]|nr:hypothetical protein [Ahrensia sp.]
MSDTTIIVLSGIVLAAMMAAIVYIIRGSRRSDPRDSKKPFRWQPEQDYEVNWSNEGPMSPLWPTLKRRPKKDAKAPPERS